MKLFTSLSASSLLLVSFALNCPAQTPFNTIEYLDINNIKAASLVHGDMWYDPALGEPRCEFPKGSGHHLSTATGLWIGGFDDNSQMRTSVSYYRQGNDFWPGPIYDATIPIDHNTSDEWAHIWKVNRTVIDGFKALSIHMVSNTPPSILEWPGRGNIYARGNNGAIVQVQNRDFAPFVDLNGNNTYEPLLGEYPDIKGDQMLWHIFNDFGPDHSQTNSESIKIEVHCSAWGYKRNTAVDNILFYEFKIVSQSVNQMDSLCLGLHSDMDLGFFADDYIGFDSSRNLGYIYNSNQNDLSSMNEGYGADIPLAGIRYLKNSTSSCSSPDPVGSFMHYFNNSDVMTGHPTNSPEFYGYMNATWRNGQHLTNDYQGPNIAAYGTGSGPQTNYAYSGDPADPLFWSECKATNIADDRKFVLSPKSFSLPAGGSVQFAFALMATTPKPLNGCPITSIGELQALADTALLVYCDPLAPVGIGAVQSFPVTLNLYPNPAHDMISLETPAKVNADDVRVFDVAGRLVYVPVSIADKKISINTTSLPGAVYHLRILGNGYAGSANFIKH
jgi:hypothetical protein